MHSVAYIDCQSSNIQVVIKNSISFTWVCHKSRVSTNNSCGNLSRTSFCICGKLCVICAATYIYDTLLCLLQLICYMSGNLYIRHLMFSGNFYITNMATSYKIFFWQLMCLTLFLVFVTTPVHNKLWFHGKFLFFLDSLNKKM